MAEAESQAVRAQLGAFEARLTEAHEFRLQMVRACEAAERARAAADALAVEERRRADAERNRADEARGDRDAALAELVRAHGETDKFRASA
jgi:hypothetical protein